MTDSVQQSSVDVAESRSTDAQDAVRSPRRSVRASLRRVDLGVPLVIAAYLVLVLCGATTSSLGMLRQNPGQFTGTEIGHPRQVRTDEWLTGTPLVLSRLASGSNQADTPLSTAPDLIWQVPGPRVAESIVFFDSQILRLGNVLPQRMLFAAWWWFPSLLLLLFLPPWLRRLGTDPPLAWLAAGLTALAPATAWWSLFPVRVLGFAVCAAYLAMRGANAVTARRWWRAAGYGVGAVVLIARLPTFYLPWSITLAVPVLLATWAWIVWPPRGRGGRATFCGLITLGALALFGALALEDHAAIHAELSTGYPGSRLSGGGLSPVATVFGAPLYGLVFGKVPGGLNQSELASSFTFALCWAALIWLTTRRVRRWDRSRAATVMLAAWAGVWLIWCSVDLGAIGRAIPALNRVTADRAAQTVGYLAVLVAVLVLSRTPGRIPNRAALVAAVGCGLLTAYGGTGLRTFYPTIRAVFVLAVALAVAVIVYVVSRYRHRAWPTVVTLVAAAAAVAWVNPVVLGLGELRGTTAAQTADRLGATARSAGDYWVTDDTYTDALFLANGVPLLSGHQVTGPRVEAWHKIDPSDRYKAKWNRGASYLTFRWTDATNASVANPAPDVIQVSVDPCALAKQFHLAGVVSTAPRSESCLSPDGTIMWNGATRYLYNVTR